MLKCGQKNNKNYTFGKTEKQIKEMQVFEEKKKCFCVSCGTKILCTSNFCPNCGEKRV